MQNPLARCAVAEETKRHVVLVAVLVCESNACSQANLSTDNSVPSKQVALLVKHVHGTALAFARTRATTVQFSHHKLRIGAEHQWMSVVAVSRDHAIGWANGLRNTGKNCLLSNVQVAKSSEFLLNVKLTTTLLELAHEVHVAEPPLVYLLGVRYRSSFLGGLLRRFGLGFSRGCRCA